MPSIVIQPKPVSCADIIVLSDVARIASVLPMYCRVSSRNCLRNPLQRERSSYMFFTCQCRRSKGMYYTSIARSTRPAAAACRCPCRRSWPGRRERVSATIFFGLRAGVVSNIRVSAKLGAPAGVTAAGSSTPCSASSTHAGQGHSGRRSNTSRRTCTSKSAPASGQLQPAQITCT